MIHDSHSLPCSWTSAIPVGCVFSGLATENIIWLNVVQSCNVHTTETQMERKLVFQRLSWDWMSSFQEWNISPSAFSFFSLWSLFCLFFQAGVKGTIALQQVTTIHLCLQNKTDALNCHWITDETWLAAMGLGIEFSCNPLVQKNLLHGKIRISY